MSESVKIREQRVRRVLAKSGMRLLKARGGRSERSSHEPGYRIVPGRKAARTGNLTPSYEADLRGIEWFAFAHSSEFEHTSKNA
jgi:hypothetical protein